MQATQEDYKGVVRLCKEKIRTAKNQAELNLATAQKIQNICINTFRIKGGLKKKIDLFCLNDVGTMEKKKLYYWLLCCHPSLLSKYL